MTPAQRGGRELSSSPKAGPSGHARPSGVGVGRKRPRQSLEQMFERQDDEEKTRLGRGYRNMQGQADDLKANLANVEVSDITALIRRQERLFKGVRDTGTATLDAKLFNTVAEASVAMAKRTLAGSNAFDVDELLLRVKAIIGIRANDEPEEDEDELDKDGEPSTRRSAHSGPLGDLAKLGWMAAGMCRRVPGIEFMYGPLAVEHKKRTVARRARKRSLPPEERPQEIQTSGKGKKDDTLANVRTVGKVLAQIDPEREGVNFFKLVVNPDSFGQTVENIFYFSFLVRDGRAGVEVKDDGEIIVRATEPHNADVEGDIPKSQAVIELDVETWEDAKSVFGINESAIPHRVYEEQTALAANSWYS